MMVCPTCFPAADQDGPIRAALIPCVAGAGGDEKNRLTLPLGTSRKSSSSRDLLYILLPF